MNGRKGKDGRRVLRRRRSGRAWGRHTTASGDRTHVVPNVLSIAGTDPTGGAGIPADLKTFGALGAYGMAVVTAVVAQNTRGVRAFRAMDPAFVADQIDAVFEDVRVDAVKIGMVANARIAVRIAERLGHHRAPGIVLDPVMVAKSGDSLLDAEAVEVLRDVLVPMATVITPNLPEAAALLGTSRSWTAAAMRSGAAELRRLGSDWVLLKGGHLEGEPLAVDVLTNGTTTLELSAPRIATTNNHGTGCTLSSAMAALLPGLGVEGAARAAKTYLTGALAAGERLEVGRGHGPLHHFHALWPSDAAMRIRRGHIPGPAAPADRRRTKKTYP